MSALNQQILDAMKQAMKAKNQAELATLRMLVAAIKNRKIELGNKEDLSDDDILSVIKSEVKKRKDSAEAYRAGGRADLVEAEEKEMAILSAYLPKQMDEAEVRQAVGQVIAQQGALGPQAFGQVMGAVMAKLKNQADGQLVSRIVKELLS